MNERNPGEELSSAQVYQMAAMLLRRHGRDAVLVADMRAGEKLNNGDMEGYRTWKRLIMLVDAMLETGPAVRENVH